MNTSFLPLLACPQCKGKLALTDGESSLLCTICQKVYPIEGGIPLLLPESAMPLHQWEQHKTKKTHE